ASAPLGLAVRTSRIGPPSGPYQSQIQAELEAVPEPQRGIAAMLPLTDLPADWTPGKSGSHYIETFSADNLYEKIDGWCP
ncbi:MAG: hypothetical protein JO161_00775, partial [Planctomycetaceae bacterium]|nr:hypothetical protein [Planctomycetaceae bacterium]